MQSKTPLPARNAPPNAKVLLEHGADLHRKVLREFGEVDPTPMGFAIQSDSATLRSMFLAVD